MEAPDDPGSADDARAAAAAAVPPASALAPKGQPVGLEDPIPVVGPDGRHERWFVATVVADRIVGFVVVGGDVPIPRWSTFQRSPGHLDACPAAADWLDPTVVAARATEVAGGAHPSGPPVLSYDGVPDRLAWRVTLDDGRAAMVAGATAWIDRPR